MTESVVHTIKTKKPNLMLIHLVDLDAQRHHHGFSSDEAQAAIRRHDVRLGKICNSTKGKWSLREIDDCCARGS